MLNHEQLICWEIENTNDPILSDIRKLYDLTQAPDERISWEWLERSVARRSTRLPGSWCAHLLAAGYRRPEGTTVIGFAYGGWLPQFGGYLCYMGVDPAARKQGIGSLLYERFFQAVGEDAAGEGSSLPLVVWESHRPDEDAPKEAWDLWTARLRLFARVGGWWIEGLDFQSPNYIDDDAPPLPLQLFVKPMDLPLEAFDAERLKAIAAGLHERIYRHGADHPLVRETLPPGCNPRLRPPPEADRLCIAHSPPFTAGVCQ